MLKTHIFFVSIFISMCHSHFREIKAVKRSVFAVVEGVVLYINLKYKMGHYLLDTQYDQYIM